MAVSSGFVLELGFFYRSLANSQVFPCTNYKMDKPLWCSVFPPCGPIWPRASSQNLMSVINELLLKCYNLFVINFGWFVVHEMMPSHKFPWTSKAVLGEQKPLQKPPEQLSCLDWFEQCGANCIIWLSCLKRLLEVQPFRGWAIQTKPLFSTPHEKCGGKQKAGVMNTDKQVQFAN